MWARQLLDRPGRFEEARSHFAAVVVADEMRRAKEMVRPDHRDWFWSNVFGSRMLNADARGAVLSSLPAPDLLATFIWLLPDAEVSAERRLLWRFNVGELEATGQPGRLLEETQRGLALRKQGTSPRQS